MKIVTDAAAFRADQAWGARDLVEIDGATARLHWTDQPYVWHRNDGAELLRLIAGQVDMHCRQHGAEEVVRLGPGDLFIAQAGDEHVAHPIGEARIPAMERRGSI